MDLCVFNFNLFYLFIKFSDGSRSNECAYCFDYSEILFLFFLWTCKLLPLYTVFSISINIWEFFAPCFTIQVGL
jgi:hypothetical protein